MNTIYHQGIIREGSAHYKWLALMVTIFGTFMAILDVTIVNVAIRSIDIYFERTLSQSEWVVSSYMLANIMMLSVSGWLETRFGFKRIYLLAIVVFIAGSLWCSLSSTLSMLVAGRFISGIGCGLLMPIGMAIVIREFADSSRGLALGLWATGIAAGVSLGPLVGGVLVTDLTWQWVFLI
ncbi:MAG: MFS transporter, partial [Rikenellaceae bacterium]